jgi:hypothetical protein
MLPSGWTVSIPGEDYDVMGTVIPSSPSNHHEITRSRDENWLTMRDINFPTDLTCWPIPVQDGRRPSKSGPSCSRAGSQDENKAGKPAPRREVKTSSHRL